MDYSSLSNVFRLLPIAILLFGSISSAQEGAPVEQPYVTARLVADTPQISLGQTFYLGVEYKMEEAWHIYWKNPGDTGIPTEIKWELPDGFTAGPLKWPTPKRYLMGGLMNYVHEGTVILMSEIQAPASLDGGSSFTFKARSDWLVCKDICVPGGADLELTLESGNNSDTAPALAAAFEANQANWPGDSADSGIEVTAYTQADSVYLVINSEKLSPSDLYFFEDNTLSLDPSGYPLSPVVDSNAQQPLTNEGSQILMTLTKSEWGPESFGQIGGVLESEQGSFFFQTEVLPGPPVSSVTPAESPAEPFTSILIYAFVGGLILNLMPCVFPVIGIKIMGFVNQAGEDRKKIIAHGVIFTAGVLVSFWILAFIFIGVRAGGETLGWGFQFFDPAMPYILAIVFLVFAMNLSGVFEIGTSVMSVGQGLSSKSGLVGTFFSGALATLVSTPCSGPYLAPALGAIATLPDISAFMVFTFIAIGLSTPYLALSIFPGLVKRLPRPGAWMESFKQFMAFLLYGAAAVMFAVFTGLVEKNEAMDSDTSLFGAVSITLVAMGVWIYGRWAAPHKTAKSKLIAKALACVLVIGGSVFGFPRESQLTWETWSAERIKQAQEAGDTVYVDFTASWCLTCQTNKKFALGTQKVIEHILDENILLLKADWTDFDQSITDELARFQRNAVPFNLVYGPGLEEPLILPEVLTPGIILDAFEDAQNP
ncbi:MAG: protein-disulfide reductase DsbD family protein [Opitutales bacterium]